MTSDLASETPIAEYSHTPKPFGAGIRFALHADSLEIADHRRTTRIALSSIGVVRLTYELRHVMTRGFRARLMPAGRRSVALTDLSYRSMIDTENKSLSYRAFIKALLPAIARANPACRFVAGRARPVWIAMALVTAAMLAGVSYGSARLAAQASAPVAIGAIAFAILLSWVTIDLVVRNRPRTFDPDNPPADLLP
ncbi:MAG: hypothetical protein ABWZ80_10750 [Beijerinckiaceae bacterium]